MTGCGGAEIFRRGAGLAPGGNRGAMSRAMCFAHLVTHGSYHRGWIADMFGQAGHRPAVIDLPVYERALRESSLAPLP